jgi:hypothetical protein
LDLAWYLPWSLELGQQVGSHQSLRLEGFCL